MCEPHTKVYRSRSTIMFDNFLGGICWGVGSVMGATVVVSLLAFLLSRSTQLPFVGKIVELVVMEFERQSSD